MVAHIHILSEVKETYQVKNGPATPETLHDMFPRPAAYGTSSVSSPRSPFIGIEAIPVAALNRFVFAIPQRDRALFTDIPHYSSGSTGRKLSHTISSTHSGYVFRWKLVCSVGDK